MNYRPSHCLFVFSFIHLVHESVPHTVRHVVFIMYNMYNSTKYDPCVCIYRVFIKYCVFPSFFLYIPDSGLSRFPFGVSECTQWQVKHQRCSRVQENHNILKNTIFNEYSGIDTVFETFTLVTPFYNTLPPWIRPARLVTAAALAAWILALRFRPPSLKSEPLHRFYFQRERLQFRV